MSKKDEILIAPRIRKKKSKSSHNKKKVIEMIDEIEEPSDCSESDDTSSNKKASSSSWSWQQIGFYVIIVVLIIFVIILIYRLNKANQRSEDSLAIASLLKRRQMYLENMLEDKGLLKREQCKVKTKKSNSIKKKLKWDPDKDTTNKEELLDALKPKELEPIIENNEVSDEDSELDDSDDIVKNRNEVLQTWSKSELIQEEDDDEN